MIMSINPLDVGPGAYTLFQSKVIHELIQMACGLCRYSSIVHAESKQCMQSDS